jgi:hypothetical protein
MLAQWQRLMPILGQPKYNLRFFGSQNPFKAARISKNYF